MTGKSWLAALCLWIPAGVILILVSSQTGINHHLRYVMPIFPFMSVAIGKLAYCLPFKIPRSALAVYCLLGWATVSSLSVRPHFISYFNEAAGGPLNGPAHLLDSNIDWGQDLLFLKSWLQKHPRASPIGLAYYNLLDPRLIGIDYYLPPRLPQHPIGVNHGRSLPKGLLPGYYAVSVNFLKGASFVAADGYGGFERLGLHEYEYFQRFVPIARAGYSIYIFHINAQDADHVGKEARLDGHPAGAAKTP